MHGPQTTIVSEVPDRMGEWLNAGIFSTRRILSIFFLVIAVLPLNLVLAHEETASVIQAQPPSTTFSPSAVELSVANPCDSMSSIDIPDPAGDASAGSPPWIDTLGVHFQQLGSDVYIRWDAATTELNDDDMLFETEHLFRLFFDTDHNSSTGQQYGGIGAEIKITLGIYRGEAAIHDFDDAGNWLDEILVPVSFLGDGFAFKMSEGLIPSKNFLLLFESIGEWSDTGGPVEVAFDPDPPEGGIRTHSANIVLESGPRLMNLPEQTVPLILTSSLVIDDTEIILDPSQVSYNISHPADHLITNPESIISIDGSGIAHYNSEGFVFVTASVTEEKCPELSGEEFILVTGNVYGQPATDDVIAVFQADYMPASSSFSFGDMMSTYPNYIFTVNLAYDMTSDLYEGFIPLNGDKQIYAPVVSENLCGGPGNPLNTAPCCYMNCGDGSPHYQVVIHEMGHNFHEAPGMAQFLWANEGRFVNEGVHECVASFPFIYFFNEISQHGGQYGLGPGTYEWSYMNDWVQSDHVDARRIDLLEELIAAGESTGFFDNPDLFESIGVFCAFFQSYMYGYDGHSTPYGHEMIRRFLNIFGKDEIPNFQEEKVETYFAAAFSISAGSDERAQLRHWGFTIDDAFYAQIEPVLAAILNANPGLIFRNSFEED